MKDFTHRTIVERAETPETVIKHTQNYNPFNPHCGRGQGAHWPSSRIYKGSSRSSSFLAVLVQSVHTVDKFFFFKAWHHQLTSLVERNLKAGNLYEDMYKKKVLRQLCGGRRMTKKKGAEGKSGSNSCLWRADVKGRFRSIAQDFGLGQFCRQQVGTFSANSFCPTLRFLSPNYQIEVKNRHIVNDINKCPLVDATSSWGT